MKKLILCILILLFVTTGCDINLNLDEAEKNWSIFEKSAKRTMVTLVVDHSNPLAEAWFKDAFTKYLAETYEISLNVIIQPMEKTLLELKADKTNENDQGMYDVIIFENKGFKEAKNGGLLYGPFGDKILNVNRLLDSKMLDYQYSEGIATDNYLIPYGRTQLSFIYNQDVFYDRPKTLEAFYEILKTEKGLFTYPNPLTTKEGEAFLLTLIGQSIDLEPFLSGNVDREAFVKVIQPTLDILNALKPYMYEKGTVYPSSFEAYDTLFNEGKTMMSMSLDFEYATNKLREYEYIEGANTFVLPTGSGTYTESAGIAYNSMNKSGAMVVIHALLSPEMQSSKYTPKLWGNLPIYASQTTPSEAIDVLKVHKLKSTTVKAVDFIESALPEFNPELIQIILEEWEKQVLQVEE